MTRGTEIPFWVKSTAVALTALLAAAVIGGMLIY